MSNESSPSLAGAEVLQGFSRNRTQSVNKDLHFPIRGELFAGLTGWPADRPQGNRRRRTTTCVHVVLVYDSGVVGGSQQCSNMRLHSVAKVSNCYCCRGRDRDKLTLGVVRGDRYCGPSHIGMGSLDSVVLSELPEGVVFCT